MFFHSDLKVSPEFIATPRKKSIFKSRQSKNKKKKNIKKLCKKNDKWFISKLAILFKLLFDICVVSINMGD